METPKQESQEQNIEKAEINENQVVNPISVEQTTAQDEEESSNGFADFIKQNKGDMKRIIGCGG
jgi:hypothetical protein